MRTDILNKTAQVKRFAWRLWGGAEGWIFPLLLLLAVTPRNSIGQTGYAEPGYNVSWRGLTEPMSLQDAVNLALEQNPALRRARKEVEASTGLQIQSRAVVMPKVRANGNYEYTEENLVDRPDLPQLASFSFGAQQAWGGGVRVVQSIYEGGRLSSSWRTARLLKEQSILRYATALADMVQEVETAYYGVLLAEQNISVQEKSVELLRKELDDTRKRFEAGTVPRFNVLRAEVELANAQPALIRARNAFRISKNNLVNILGVSTGEMPGTEIPLKLTDQLKAEPYEVELGKAIHTAFERRPELKALEKSESLREEELVRARSSSRPSIQAFGGYQARNSVFTSDLNSDLHGWVVGASATWEIFDGGLTRGKVMEARARRDQSVVETEEAQRNIELEVRTAYSRFIEAKEMLASQLKVQEQAEEALRLATARSTAGTGTQLDVLSAQTALTQARTTQLQALHDYQVARVRLERAIGTIVSDTALPSQR